MPDFAHLDGPPNDLVARQFDDEWTNMLFVGRVIPNKRIENVIRFFAAYKTRYNPRSRLLIVGSYGGFERYLAMLQQLVARLGVPDVHFTGHVSNEELTAYYDVADLFLCASEHEGFCVPLVEAFYKRIPVLALRAHGGAGHDGRRRRAVRRRRTRPSVATLLDAVVGDAALQERILAGQDAALERLRRRDFGGTLLRFVDQVLAAPRRPDTAWRGTSGSSSTRSSGSRSSGCSARPSTRRCRRPPGPAASTGSARAPDDGHQPVGAGGTSGRRDRRQRPARARPAARAWATSPISSR